MKGSPFQASCSLSMAKRLIEAVNDDRVPNAIVYPSLVCGPLRADLIQLQGMLAVSLLENEMALNSKYHDIYLNMPIEATLLPELRGLPYWGRTVHEVLQEVNPRLMRLLAEGQKLQTYIERMQDHLQQEAAQLEREWRRLHPLSIDAGYLVRASWQRHCKLAVREMLIDELAKSLIDNAAEQ